MSSLFQLDQTFPFLKEKSVHVLTLRWISSVPTHLDLNFSAVDCCIVRWGFVQRNWRIETLVGKWEIVQSYFPLYKCYIRITWSDIDVSQVKVRRTNDRRRIRRNRSSQFRGPLPVGRTGETVQIIPSGKLNVHVVLVADVALFKNLLSGRSR